MRIIFIFAVLFLALPLHAAETAGESRFHLLSSKCEAEVSDGPETTPQSPPLNVDDPSTPGCNKWEINVVLDGDFTRDQKSYELPLLDVNYGIGDNIQLKFEAPYASNQSEGTTVSAMGESRVGIKYSFFEDEEAKLVFAIYPQLTFVSSSSDAVSKGLATPGTITTLPLLMSKKIGQTSQGDVNLTANLGYNISTKEDTSDYVSVMVGVGVPLHNRLAIMSEIATEQAVTKNPAQVDTSRQQLVKAGVGLIGTVNRQFLLFGSVGRSLYASDAIDHTYVLAGVRLLAGGIVK